MAKLLVFALVLVQALAIQACNVRDAELTTIAELRELAKGVPTSNCPNYLKQAVVDLATIVSQDSKDLCSMDAIDTLRFYYTQYMDNASIKEDHKEKLPDNVRDFVIAYGLQMSNLCKKEMVKVLTEEAPKLLTADDFKMVEKLVEDQGPIAGVLKSMGSPDEIFLPGDLAPLMKNNGQGLGTGEKVFMQTATGPWVRRLQGVCQHRFKPLYESLMIPLTRLSYMGFNYKDESLKCALECPRNIMEVAKWARIVLICESLDSIAIVEDPESWAETEGTDMSQVKIISKEEAAAIERPNGSEQDSGVDDLVYASEYKVTLGDIVYDRSDAEFAKIVKSFKVGQSEAQLVKRAMVSKGMSFMKQQLKKGKLSLIVSTAFKSLTGKKVNSPGEALVRTLDEIVASKQANGEDAVSVGAAGVIAAGSVAMSGGGGGGSYFGGGADFDAFSLGSIFSGILTFLIVLGVCVGLPVAMALG